MSTRQTQFFMRLSEFADFAQEVERTCGTTFIEYRRDNSIVHAGSIKEVMALLSRDPTNRKFYLAESVPSVMPLHQNFAPGREGWVGLDVPCEDGNRLLMSDLGSRSDWGEGGVRHDSPVAHKLYGRVVKILRRRLKFPTWVVTIRPTVGTPMACKGLGYTPGAEAWFNEGKELWQEGVANQRFMPCAGPLPGGTH
jgi:hypothetical protein